MITREIRTTCYEQRVEWRTFRFLVQLRLSDDDCEMLWASSRTNDLLIPSLEGRQLSHKRHCYHYNLQVYVRRRWRLLTSILQPTISNALDVTPSGLPKRPLYFSRKTPSTMLGVKRFYFNFNFHVTFYLQCTVMGPSSSCCSYAFCTCPIKSKMSPPLSESFESVQPKKWNCLIFRTVPL